ncbi:MAG: hypothetical protein ACOC55_05410, partial [Candidatus Natronoplasma sp.]
WTAEEEGETELMVKSVDDGKEVEDTSELTVVVESSDIWSWWLLALVLVIVVSILVILFTSKNRREEEENGSS